MNVVIPFVKKTESIPKLYTRYINKKPVYEYIINTLKDFIYQIDLQVVTDIEKIYMCYKDDSSLACYYMNLNEWSKKIGQKSSLIINPSFPFLSCKTINLMIKHAKSEHSILFKGNNKWIGFFGKAEDFMFQYFDRAKTINLKLTGYEEICLDDRKGWWIAERELKKKRIVIHPVSSRTLGMGHVYRGLTLATRLSVGHEILFLLHKDQKVAIEMIKNEGYSYYVYDKDCTTFIEKIRPDIVINDMLNTSKVYIKRLKQLGCRVINFEDMGDGAEYADAVINALYPGNVPMGNFFTGEKFYCIREDFCNAPKKILKPDVKEILLTYGGSDPNALTLKTLLALKEIQDKYGFHIRIILGPAFEEHDVIYKTIYENGLEKRTTVHETVNDMAYYMHKADIIFTSAGRTMYEIATIATPAIVIAQNYRELTHTFGHPYNGFYHLGYHEEVKTRDIQQATERLINDYQLRQLMHHRMRKIDLTKGIDRVIKIILGEDDDIV